MAFQATSWNFYRVNFTLLLAAVHIISALGHFLTQFTMPFNFVSAFTYSLWDCVRDCDCLRVLYVMFISKREGV